MQDTLKQIVDSIGAYVPNLIGIGGRNVAARKLEEWTVDKREKQHRLQISGLASIKNGMLNLIIPKTEAAKPKAIEVKIKQSHSIPK